MALLKHHWRKLAFAIVAFAVAIVPIILTGTDARYVLKVLTFVGINALIVLGLALLFGYAGQVSMGHAAFFGLGAYASAWVTKSLGLPWLVGLAAAVLLTALAGILLALPSLRLKGHYLAMATLAFGEIMRIAFVEAKGVTGGPDGLSGIPYASIGPIHFDTPQLNYWLVWGVLSLALWLAANIVSGRPGRSMRALHGSELGTMASGINITGIKVRVFTLSAVFAGVAGALYASIVGFVSPSTFSLHLSVILVAMAVLGGTRSLMGPLLAAVVLTLIPYADAILPGLPREVMTVVQEWEADVYGLIIIIVMLFMPGGIAAGLRGLVVRGDEAK